MIEVKADRLRLSVQKTAVKIAFASAVALCAVLWLGAASLATLRGLCGGFAALCGGRVWLGELCGGAFALLLAAGTAGLLLRLSTRRELARLEKKYERIRNAPAGNEDHAGPAANRGDAPRSRGNPGDTADRNRAAAPV
ncbi:MAG: hypothetical protein IPJ19_15530 [Planctomycetes bacterium]|nr:hypothetical protein [Planctomycetota bacterium]